MSSWPICYLLNGKGEPKMLETLKKAMLAGIGLALITKDEVEQMAKDLVKKGEMSEKEGKRFMDDLVQKYESSVEKLESRVEKTVRDFLKKADVVTRDELETLKQDIADIKKTVTREQIK
jgi:polyhydroxyalkanoate synthesis regulator phasin